MRKGVRAKVLTTVLVSTFVFSLFCCLLCHSGALKHMLWRNCMIKNKVWHCSVLKHALCHNGTLKHVL